MKTIVCRRVVLTFIEHNILYLIKFIFAAVFAAVGYDKNICEGKTKDITHLMGRACHFKRSVLQACTYTPSLW